MSNHHANKATELVIAAATGGSHIDPDTAALMTAQSEATLALAYEQRTANLIALKAVTRDGGLTMKLNRKIKERLGIE